MTSRFASNLVVLLAGATMVAFSLALRPVALGWVGLGLGCMVVLTVILAFLARGRGVAQRVVDGLLVVAGAWTIVAMRSFDGLALKWICFGMGALLASLAVVGLVVHEIAVELALRARMPPWRDAWMPADGRERPDARERPDGREREPAR